jgi:hypothetical protein
MVIFAGTFILCGFFITPYLPAIFHSYVELGGFGTNNPAGAVLGAIAATSSFNATLKRKRPKPQPDPVG